MCSASIVLEDPFADGGQVDVSFAELENEGAFDGEVLVKVLQDLLTLVYSCKEQFVYRVSLGNAKESRTNVV